MPAFWLRDSRDVIPCLGSLAAQASSFLVFCQDNFAEQPWLRPCSCIAFCFATGSADDSYVGPELILFKNQDGPFGHEDYDDYDDDDDDNNNDDNDDGVITWEPCPPYPPSPQAQNPPPKAKARRCSTPKNPL